MRCRTCDYPLWNLTTGTCPECGAAFLPSEYEFVANSVRFCCPQCQQAYYGTGPKGQLTPPTFDCVNCGRGLTMDQMVLLPAEGIDESATTADRVPWLHRRREGRFKGWLRTVGLALFSPMRLMKAMPPGSSLGAAWGFAFVTACVIAAAAAFVPAMVFMVPFLFMAGRAGGGPGPGQFIAVMGGSLAVMMIGAIGMAMAWTAVWGLATHGLLRLTGATAGPLRRTYQALCYSSGANVATIIPCFGGWVGGIWWVVGAVLMVKEAQALRGPRAVFCVIAPPGVLMGILGALYIGLIIHATTGSTVAQARQTADTIQRTRAIVNGLLAASVAGGRGPTHALRLVETEVFSADDFVIRSSRTTIDDVPVGAGSLGDLIFISAAERRQEIADTIDAMPMGLVAHRVGDFVFTYHGLDLGQQDPVLWVVVMVPDPDVNGAPRPGDQIVIGLADGSVRITSYLALTATELSAQNDHRADLGLLPLPDPASVTHGAPGVETAP